MCQFFPVSPTSLSIPQVFGQSLFLLALVALHPKTVKGPKLGKGGYTHPDGQKSNPTSRPIMTYLLLFRLPTGWPPEVGGVGGKLAILFHETAKFLLPFGSPYLFFSFLPAPSLSLLRKTDFPPPPGPKSKLRPQSPTTWQPIKN